jgi:hypothetical protein
MLPSDIHVFAAARRNPENIQGNHLAVGIYLMTLFSREPTMRTHGVGLEGHEK